MATLAPSPQRTTSAATSWGVVFAPPEYAQGDEGRLLDDGAIRAAARWRGPSEYVATLLTGRNESSRTARMLPAAGLLAVSCAVLAFCGFVSDLGAVFFPLAGGAGLAAYTFFAHWVARQESQSRLLIFAERIRRAIAYEGDLKSKTR